MVEVQPFIFCGGLWFSEVNVANGFPQSALMVCRFFFLQVALTGLTAGISWFSYVSSKKEGYNILRDFVSTKKERYNRLRVFC